MSSRDGRDACMHGRFEALAIGQLAAIVMDFPFGRAMT